MSVLFCLWADQGQDEEQEREEVVGEERSVESMDVGDDDGSASTDEVNDDACNSDFDTVGKIAAIVQAVDTSISSKDDIGVNNSSCSIKEPRDELQTCFSLSNKPSEKESLRTPSMVFSVWKDPDKEWKSDDSEEFLEEEDDNRPRFFSFQHKKDKENDNVVDREKEKRKEFVNEQSEAIDKDQYLADLDEEFIDDKEIYDTDDSKIEIYDDVKNISSNENETDIGCNDSVDSLVIKKVETSREETENVKTEPIVCRNDNLEYNEEEAFENVSKKSFARKSTTPRCRINISKPLKINISKMSVITSESKTPEGSERKTNKSTGNNVKRKRSQTAIPSKTALNLEYKPKLSTKRTLNTTKVSAVQSPSTNEVKVEVCGYDEYHDIFSLCTDTIEVEESITQLKMEEEEGADYQEDDVCEYTSLGDPLGDPLSTQVCSSATDRPFLWPRLDPLFHTVTEFRLSKHFAKLVKAVQKPTAKIQPLLRSDLDQPRIKTDVKDEGDGSTPPAPGAKKRSGKRKKTLGVPSSELKSLLSTSQFYTHPPAQILPRRRRSLRQEDKGKEFVQLEEEAIIVGKKRKLPPKLNEKPAKPSKETSSQPIKPDKKDKPDQSTKSARGSKPEQVNNSARISKPIKRKKKDRAGEPDVSIVGSVSRPTTEGVYQVVCKSGLYQCPLCTTRWSLNQTYGRHVVTRTCQGDVEKTSLTSAPWILAEADPDEDVAILEQSAFQPNKIFVFVNPATSKKDSFVSTSHVPSLKLLCRSVLPQSVTPPPLSVKEGLEYYHSLVWPENSKEDDVFKFMCRQADLTMVTSVNAYEKLCREPLKVALYLEKKISKSREIVGPRHSQTRRWVEKYTLYLTFPLHDIFLVVSQTGYRVLEFPHEGQVGLLCLVCPIMYCPGCLTKHNTRTSTLKGKKPPLKVSLRTKVPTSKARKIVATTSTPITASKSHSSKSISSSSVSNKPVKASPTVPTVPPLQLIMCSPCKTVFNSKLALYSHKGLCRGMQEGEG